MRPSRRSEDPRLPLLFLAGVAILVAWRLLSHLQVHAPSLLHSPVSPVAIALGATAISSAPVMQRLLSTRRTLADRRAVAIVPADGFDPGPEDIASFAAQIARSASRTGAWADRPASAVRVRLTNDAEGRLVYLLELPGRDASLLRSALRRFRGIEMRDPDDVLGAEAEDRRGEPLLHTVRAEMVLSGPASDPLARPPLDPDPLTPFAAALAGLRRDRGEEAEVCVDLLPAVGRREGRLRSRMRRRARVRYDRRSFMEMLGGEEGSRRRSDPVERLERRALDRGLEAKLAAGTTLFEAQIILRVTARGRGRSRSVMRAVVSAFAPMADRNRLRVSGLAVPPFGFLGSDLPLRRGRFDHRRATGLFRPARRNVLTAAEVAGFLKPPTLACPVEEVLRSGAILSRPPALTTFEPDHADLIPIGRVTGEGGGRLVGVTAEDTFFTYVAGRSRYGKTETAITMFTHLVRSGHGGLFLDPHGDALERIRPHLGDPGVAGRVVEIDLGPGSRDAQPAWNLFDTRGAAPEERVEAIVASFAAALRWGEQSTRAINLTTQTASALAAIARVLPEALAPTIFQMPTLLTDASWRETVLHFLPAHAQGFWRERFPLLSSEAVTPLTNLVDRLRASTATTALLGQGRGTFGVREAMDEGLVVLACPGAGGPRERLLAGLLAYELLHAARSRAELSASARRPFVAVFDELQTYDGESLAALLEQSAKFGLRAIFLNQDPERLRPATLHALTTNRSHLLATALNSHAAALVSRELGGEPDPASLTRLRRHRFVAQVTSAGELSRPFALAGIRVEDALGEPQEGGRARLEVAIEASGRRRPAAEALANLETLDVRILAALKERRRADAKEEVAAQEVPSGPIEVELEEEG